MNDFRQKMYLQGVREKRGEAGYDLLVSDIEKVKEKLNDT